MAEQEVVYHDIEVKGFRNPTMSDTYVIDASAKLRVDVHYKTLRFLGKCFVNPQKSAELQVGDQLIRAAKWSPAEDVLAAIGPDQFEGNDTRSVLTRLALCPVNELGP